MSHHNTPAETSAEEQAVELDLAPLSSHESKRRALASKAEMERNYRRLAALPVPEGQTEMFP